MLGVTVLHIRPGEEAMSAPTRFGFSHMELCCADLERMRAFYTGVLGFLVTDEGGLGERRLVFLSRNPAEHHQLVLTNGRSGPGAEPAFRHAAFRMESLAELRELWRRVSAEPHGPLEPVTHGNTWSLYFRDPEGNRLECFVDTPWHTPQPCRERVDYERPDAELFAQTEALCRGRPGFQTREAFLAQMAARFAR
jgi:catechol 2,3-dioxygenase